MSDTERWEPGDPLFSILLAPNSRYLFNIRADSEREACNCTDAAHWPEPRGDHALSSDDPLTRFIRQTRDAS